MADCTIRYRLDGSGPVAYVVECAGRFHIYARGALGSAVSSDQLQALLAVRGGRWVPATGDISLERANVPPPDLMSLGEASLS